MIKEFKFENHEEWLAIRAKYIGGSDAGAVMGMNPYTSAYTLWAEKTGKIPAFEGSITTKVGAYLEALVADMFTEETGKKVHKKNATMVNDLYPFACANVDRLVVGEKSLLEIKTTTSLSRMKQVKGGSFHDEWYCQMMHYLAVTGLERAYLAVLVNCREFYTFTLERDEEEIKALMEAEKHFWEHVETNTPPEVDGTDSTADTISQLYPNSNGEECSLFAFENDLKQYLEIGEQIKALKNMQDECANRVKVFMNEASKGTSDNYKVTWSQATKRSFNTKKFEADHKAEDLSAYYNETTYRTFKVTERKGDK